MAANELRQLIRVRIGAGVPESGDPAAHQAELDVNAWNRARVEERDGSAPAAPIGHLEQHVRELWDD